MPDRAHLLAFLSAALVLALLPGPGMLYVLARSLGGGTRVGLRSTLGTAAGGMGHVTAATIGLSALLMTSAVTFEVVKLAGAVYLIVLGVRTLLSLRGAELDIAPDADKAARGAFRQGVLTELLNPKTALFFLAFLPQFVQADRGPIALQIAVLGTFTVLLNSCSDLSVAAAAGPLGSLLQRRPHLLRRQRAVSGCALIALGGYAAASGSR
jgi:threonine/homoserine/homoserine lactone efflux protein